jgi:hypothetical protein
MGRPKSIYTILWGSLLAREGLFAIATSDPLRLNMCLMMALKMAKSRKMLIAKVAFEGVSMVQCPQNHIAVVPRERH